MGTGESVIATPRTGFYLRPVHPCSAFCLEVKQNLGGINMACETCTPATVPYIVYETEQARAERHIKRLWIALIVAITMLFVSNVGWLIYESQFATVSYVQDGEGMNNVNIGEQGDLFYGADSESEG